MSVYTDTKTDGQNMAVPTVFPQANVSQPKQCIAVTLHLATMEYYHLLVLYIGFNISLATMGFEPSIEESPIMEECAELGSICFPAFYCVRWGQLIIFLTFI